MAMNEHASQFSTPTGKPSLDRPSMLGQGTQNVGSRVNYLCTQDTVNVEMVRLSVHAVYSIIERR